VVNPSTGDINFIFDTNTTSLGTRFNVTLQVTGYGNPSVFAWQARLNYDPILLNVTQVWNLTVDSAYIFYGRGSFSPPPFMETGTVLVGDSLLSGTGKTPPPDPAKLATIEFGIIYAPISGKVSTSLSIDNADTYLLADTLDEIPITKTNGYFEYVYARPGMVRSTITINVSEASVVVGSDVTISGTISPVRPDVDVTIYTRLKGEQWAALPTVKTNNASNYEKVWTPSVAGTFELKASWQGDDNTIRADSTITTVVVSQVLDVGIIIIWAIVIVILVAIVVIVVIYIRRRRSRPK